jgi:hypothetical protein
VRRTFFDKKIFIDKHFGDLPVVSYPLGATHFLLTFSPPAPRFAGASPHFASKIGGQRKLLPGIPLGISGQAQIKRGAAIHLGSCFFANPSLLGYD